MYDTQEIAGRIKHLLKAQQINTKDMLSTLGMGINAISEFSKGKQMSCLSLASIADYLGCSVDYLLGRTENPSCNSSETGYNRSKENTPAPAEPETGEAFKKRAASFYNELVRMGYLTEGEDFTDAQVRIVADVLDILDAVFPKRTVPESNKTREVG